MKDQIIKALKEGARVVVIAIIPITIDGLIMGAVDYRLVFITAVITGLRFLDKLLHEVGKKENNTTLMKGITRF